MLTLASGRGGSLDLVWYVVRWILRGGEEEERDSETEGEARSAEPGKGLSLLETEQRGRVVYLSAESR